MGQKEFKYLGTKVIKTLLSKILLHPTPISVSMVPFFEYMSTEIQTFHFDMNNV